MENYKRYLIDHLDMGTDEADLFLSGFEVVEYQKGDMLVKAGENCSKVRVIIEGSARGFVVIEGKDITTNFYFDYDHTYDYVNYLLNKKAEISIQALDKIKSIEMSLSALEFLKSEVVGFHRMSFNMFKMNYIKAEKERKGFITMSPKRRYLDLLKNNKQVISSVPQHQVASYIGVSPEHLSRIRKDISIS